MSSVRNELALANAQELINVRNTFLPPHDSTCIHAKDIIIVAFDPPHRKQTTSATQSV